MSEIGAMQQKTINFNNWLCELVQVYVPDCTEKKKAIAKFENYFKDEKNYNDFMFSTIPMLCSVLKPSVQNIRDLKDREKRDIALGSIKTRFSIIGDLIKNVLAMEQQEMDQILLKLSLYVNLFTDVYFTASKVQVVQTE
jgi:hypothetical protein